MDQFDKLPGQGPDHVTLEGVGVYKCRLCGETHEHGRMTQGAFTNVALWMSAKFTAKRSEERREAAGRPCPDLIWVHECKDGRTGISDLIGFVPDGWKPTSGTMR